MNEVTVKEVQKDVLQDYGVVLTVERIQSTFIKDYVGAPNANQIFQVSLKKGNKIITYGAYPTELVAACCGAVKVHKAGSFENLNK